MAGYRMVDTTFYQPTTRPVPGAPAQGEWVNGGFVPVLECRGLFSRREAKLVDSPFGQAERARYRWRSRLPDGFEPQCGWQLGIEGCRYCIIGVKAAPGKTSQLDLECVA
jgi:hypothetical protein